MINLEEKNELNLEIYEIIRELGERDLIVNYRIVKYLLEQFLDSGKVETFGRKDFLKFLPWQKSQLTERLQGMVEEGLLLFEKRKYSLNIDNPFVNRVKEGLRYQWDEYDLEKILLELIDERKNEHKKEVRYIPKEKEEKKNLRQTTEEETMSFLKNIYNTYWELGGTMSEEELIEFMAKEIEDNILLTIGLTRNVDK
ncbi:MAG: hypothetical protein KGD59_00010 [Candidatus Heimdallarchaeota archaeon]|nr:hypothetical protein [Candidatus Heimdallarchaeota archaeon]